MKKYILIALSSVLTFTSCYKEPAIVPVITDGLDGRYEFPQGDDAWDRDLKQIFDDFDTYVIYDKLSDYDFNRSWTSSAGAGYFGQSLQNDDQRKFQITFLKDHVFKFFNPETIKRVFPMYIYLGWSVYTPFYIQTLFLGNFVPLIRTEGMDYWMICLESDCCTPEQAVYGYKDRVRPTTVEEVTTTRGLIMVNIIRKAFDKNLIETPKVFFDSFDYKTAVKYKEADENDTNHFWKRGFAGNETNMSNFEISHVGGLNNITPTRVFERYIMLALKYTREELVAGQFKIAVDRTYTATCDVKKYPKILQYYDLTVKYLKESYGWDVTQVPANRGIVDVKY